MHSKLLIVLSVATLSAVLGCEAHPAESLPQSPTPGAALVVPPAPGAAPSSDASLPPVGTAALQKDEGTTAPAAGSELTRRELNTQMPLPGQVNDYSTPERAKQESAPGNTVK